MRTARVGFQPSARVLCCEDCCEDCRHRFDFERQGCVAHTLQLLSVGVLRFLNSGKTTEVLRVQLNVYDNTAQFIAAKHLDG